MHVAELHVAGASPMSDVTQILGQIEPGNGRAAEKFPPLVYDELCRLAAAKMAQEATGPDVAGHGAGPHEISAMHVEDGWFLVDLHRNRGMKPPSAATGR